ncbi:MULTISPECIES: OmpA family protein [unclassified Pseudomonas]|uniref:OmpA family protein n=1 Tax=unclassified Pseudomonas TaxID=196821 RepID=UPI000BDA4CFB|nr:MULTISPECIES: OmpA family protein [unclassified Pseudomonas]PVZ19639.1 type VI secretion system protein VasL [Pseudomonas sp. URIL14HWK12:I12]PVZ22776.1 type VI secretion system protein VasL [Pseudomonas sp. URIL14HWK12:I10]PVZ37594.1 type VI secretion system protein VasL [Pseudomonas sp. URIL14HWK12:I11]SNZ15211.1 Outer membrane protein and related peptidoglycan-associated (lipo)proteins [Pseudomonas sp. URIL14HWK12:I9]
MTLPSPLTLGADPRRTPEFGQLRQALAPLAHPACPDVNWPQVRACAQALLRAHGAELQGLRALALAHLWCGEPQAAAAVIRCVAHLIVEHCASLWPTEGGQRQALIDQWCTQVLVWSRCAASEDVEVISSALATLQRALETTLQVTPLALHALLRRRGQQQVPIPVLPSGDLQATRIGGGQGNTPRHSRSRSLLLRLAGAMIICIASTLWMQPRPQLPPIDVAELALFDAGSAQLGTQALELLTSLVGLVAHHPGWLIEVRGHSDASGSAEHNHSLAKARAAAVGRWLAAHGVPAQCIRTLGVGADRPLLANTTAAGRAANRRVTIRLTHTTPPCPFTQPATTAARPSPATGALLPRPSGPEPHRR